MRVQKHDSGQPEFNFGLESVRRELRAVTYSDWLEFYTPLSSRGQGNWGVV